MSASIIESHIGDIPWLVVSGEREDVFRALGEHSARAIRTLIENLPELSVLRRRAAGESSAHLRAVVETTRERHPVEYGEIEALAAGAAVDSGDLLLLALRGDLGPRQDGCSDLGWSDGRRAVLGHNEDGNSALHGLCSLMTLRIDTEPAIVTWWYPGFLPGNTFSFNEHGLVWGVDAIHINAPPAAPGRAFVARSLLRARTPAEMAAYVRSHPVAGAFAYVIGRLGSPQLLVLEQAGDQVAAFETATGYVWHTNHLRHLPTSLNVASTDSLSRGAVLDGAISRAGSGSVASILEILTASPPKGVRAEGSALTLCTFVADLESGTLTLREHDGSDVTAHLADLLHG